MVRNGAAAWLDAVRPRTLGAGAVPVMVGISWASRSVTIDPGVALLTAVAALALQIATNLANDYYDHRSGIDTAERLGPARASASGLLEPTSVKHAAYAALALAIVVGVALVARGGVPILLLGAAAVSCAIAYSAGPAPLASHGLGEALAFLFFGVAAVAGTALLQGVALDAKLVLVALPVAALVTAIMLVNNLRDIPTDRATGKRTLAVRLGDRGSRLAYGTLVAGAFVALPVAARLAGMRALLPLLLLPLALVEVRRLWQRQGRALNLSLAGTARLHALFGVLYALGLLR